MPSGGARFWAALASIALAAGASRPQLPEEFQPLVGLARAAPPEIAAAALLRIAASPKVSEDALKRELIEDAFRLAAGAAEKLPRRHLPGLSPDSRSGSLARALRLKLDALSLQTRAALDLLAIDRSKARELFSEITPPAPAALSCEDPLVWDPGDYYAALARITNETFSAAERRKHLHLEFARARLVPLVSPAQVPAAARAAGEIKLDAAGRALLAASFAAALEAVPQDPRSYHFYMEDAGRAVAALAGALESADPAAGAALRNAFQKYTANQMAAPQCAEAEVFDVGAILRRQAGQAPASPPRPAARVHGYWTAPESQALAASALKLRWGPTGQPGRMLSEEERRQPEWHSQLAEVLNRMESWRPAPEETAADFYHQRAILYQALADLTPAGRPRDNLIRAFVAFTAASNLQREAPAEWFCHTLDLLDRLRPSPEARNLLLDELAGSGNPALALAAALDRLLPAATPGAPVPAP